MQELNIWLYLANVAPVVVVMAIAIVALWLQNKELTKDIKESDLNNLKTLQNIANAIEKTDETGDRNYRQLREHITERTQLLASQIKARQ